MIDIDQSTYIALDFFYTAIALFIAYLSIKSYQFRHSNKILAYQFFITTGFTVTLISLDIDIHSSWLYFYAFHMMVFFTTYHYISLTGDRLQAGLCKVIGIFHLCLIAGLSMGVFTINGIYDGYGLVMLFLSAAQLVIAFKGWWYGKHIRIDRRSATTGNWHSRSYGGDK